MDYDDLVRARSSHPAWTLLCSKNAPLVLGFLGRVFVDANADPLPASVLAEELDEELYALNQRLGEGTFPKAAAAYLDDWAAPERGWLRKYYPPSSDEAHFDLAPAVEKAVAWVRELRPRPFIGTESRLNTVVELLRQMVRGADPDPQNRLAVLRRQRDQLDAEIERAERGDIDILDPVSQRDRYQQFASTARELLSDFRELEDNFRNLDRRLREQIAGWEGSKGELLDEIVGSRSDIAESDQGRSFRAFYDLLLSPERQAELDQLLRRLPEIDGLADQDPRLTRIHYDWIDASERTQATVRLLSEQLRRFLDDQVWLENRRVFELLRGIEAKALVLRDSPTAVEMEMNDTRMSPVLPVERPLYRMTAMPALDSRSPGEGEDDFDSSVLLDQIHVDRERLLQAVFRSLGHTGAAALEEVIQGQPLENGLADLIGYLSLHDNGLVVDFDEDGRARISWSAEDVDRVADLPLVTFRREHST